MNTLIVDDDLTTLTLIKNSIKWTSLGIENVFTAYNVVEAKRIVRNNEIAIVISDIEMPGQNGVEFLKWYRENNYEGKFFFLTSHENFSYASASIKYHVTDYLLKPFDVFVMEAALKKIVAEIAEEEAKKNDLNYGRWIKQNADRLWLDFLYAIFEGRIVDDWNKENLERNFSVSTDDEYVLIVSYLTDVEKDLEKMNPDLFRFVIEQLYGEVFFQSKTNKNIVCIQNNSNYFVINVCPVDIVKKFDTIFDTFDKKLHAILSLTATTCISDNVKLRFFYNKFDSIRDILTNAVSFVGTHFFEKDAVLLDTNVVQGIDINFIAENLEKKDKLKIMSYLKRFLSEHTQNRSLDSNALKSIRQELLQCVYIYFAKRNVTPTGFLTKDIEVGLTKKAGETVMDMIKWANYLIEQTFENLDQTKQSMTLEERINEYIRTHYRENIGRSEIADEFCLAPEYIAKLYKKRTGLSIKDYLNQYRIEQAKLLLENETLRISEISEMTGFDSFAYFSTIFKKYMDVSPIEYRKKLGIMS